MSAKDILNPSDYIDDDDDELDKPTKAILNAGHAAIGGAIAGAELGGPAGAILGGVVAGVGSIIKSAIED